MYTTHMELQMHHRCFTYIRACDSPRQSRVRNENYSVVCFDIATVFETGYMYL